MSADTLRRAAAVLRERAEAATAGTWGQNGFEYDDIADEFTYDVMVTGSAHSLAYADRKEDADYIALMHPGVGLALADGLQLEADRLGWLENYATPQALAVARLILGESS